MKGILPLVLVVGFLAVIGAVWSGNLKSNVSTMPLPGVTGLMEKEVIQQISLSVTSPTNGATVTTPQVSVRGSTAANAEVSVNETDVKADANGNFSALVTLDEGENTIFIVATDNDGNIAEKEVRVTYNAG